jgi:hypothetical protein
MKIRAFRSQREKMVFFEKYFGFSKLDIFKNVQNSIPFLLFRNTFLHFSKLGKYISFFIIIYKNEYIISYYLKCILNNMQLYD